MHKMKLSLYCCFLHFSLGFFVCLLCLFAALVNYSQQVRHLRHHATHRVRVRTLHDLIQLSQTKTAHDRLVRFRRSDKAAIVLDANLAFGCLFVSGFTRHITSPQPACRASEPVPSDPSCATTRRKSRALRCADWSIPALSYARPSHPLPASPHAPRPPR